MPQVNHAHTALHPSAWQQPSVMKRARLVICQRWPYACLNLENHPRSPEADTRMREVILRSRKLREEQRSQMPHGRIKASPSRRQKTYKKQPRTLLNSAVRIWVTWVSVNAETLIAFYTEPGIKVCAWLREISSCSCLTVLPGPACLLLNKICVPFFRTLYMLQHPMLSLWNLTYIRIDERYHEYCVWGDSRNLLPLVSNPSRWHVALTDTHFAIVDSISVFCIWPHVSSSIQFTRLAFHIKLWEKVCPGNTYLEMFPLIV